MLVPSQINFFVRTVGTVAKGLGGQEAKPLQAASSQVKTKSSRPWQANLNQAGPHPRTSQAELIWIWLDACQGLSKDGSGVEKAR
jgi:hypothetical protein